MASSFFLDARYTSNYVTDAEMASLSSRGQDQVKRAAQAHQGPTYTYGAAAVAPIRYRRVGECITYMHVRVMRLNDYLVDWLKDRIFLEGMRKDDRYVQDRLGFQAANIFVMSLTNY